MLLTPQALQDLLTNWHARRWLRDLDIVFVQFLLDMDANADPLVLLAAALASHQLGRGHICLDLDYCVAAPNDALALPPDGDYQYHKADLPSQQLSGLDLTAWLAALNQSALVQAAGSPLLVDGNRLYLRRYRQYELNIAQAIQTRLQETSAVADDFGEHIQALFPQQRVQGPNWQKIACALAARRAFAVITGGPGTGKTWTVVRLLALLQATATHKLRIRLAAPTGKAAARLTEAIRKALPDLPANYAAELPDQASTLHRLLGSRPGSRLFKHNTTNPLHADVVIIDEASMIDVEMMNALLLALKIETRLILLGDKDQLASVEAGSVLGDICQIGTQAGYSQATTTWLEHLCAEDVVCAEHGQPMQLLSEQIIVLKTSRRFDEHSGIGQLARAVNAGDSQMLEDSFQNRQFTDITRILLSDAQDSQLDHLVVAGGMDFFTGANAVAVSGYSHYLSIMQQTRPAPDSASQAYQDWAQQVLAAFDQFRLLCALRQGDWGVTGLNQRIYENLLAAELIKDRHDWYEGRPVMITQNDYSLGLMNGDIGIALQFPTPLSNAENTGLRVVFPQPDGIKTILPSRLSAYETAYAMTVHKSQGSEFNHVALVLPDKFSPVLTRELVYTGITRAKNYFSLLSTDVTLLNKAISNPVRRSGGLADLLRDYVD